MTTPAANATRFAISVMSRDRIGIVRDVTNALAPWQANIDFVSQTVVVDYFTLTLVARFPEPHTADEVRAVLRHAGQPGELEVSVKVVDPTGPATAAPSTKRPTDRFILTAIGGDRPGIVHHLAVYLAGKGINITDLYGVTTADQQFIVVSELTVPQQLDLTQIQLDIEALGRQIGLALTLQHENIFRATNEVTAPSILH